MISGRVLDVSALQDFAALGTVYVQALTWHAMDHGVVLAVPLAALASAWPAGNAEREVLGVLMSLPITIIDPLDDSAASAMGDLLAGRRGACADVATAHVAYSATRRGWPVVTARPDRFRSLMPTLAIDRIP